MEVWGGVETDRGQLKLKVQNYLRNQKKQCCLPCNTELFSFNNNYYYYNKTSFTENSNKSNNIEHNAYMDINSKNDILKQNRKENKSQNKN